MAFAIHAAALASIGVAAGALAPEAAPIVGTFAAISLARYVRPAYGLFALPFIGIAQSMKDLYHAAKDKISGEASKAASGLPSNDTIKEEAIKFAKQAIDKYNAAAEKHEEEAKALRDWAPTVSMPPHDKEKGFCPTGPGGGIDNTCGRESAGAAVAASERTPVQVRQVEIDRAMLSISLLNRAKERGEGVSEAAKAVTTTLSKMRLVELRALREQLKFSSKARSQAALVEKLRQEIGKQSGVNMDNPDKPQKFGKSIAKVEIANRGIDRGSKERTLERITRMLGENATAQDVASVVGAPKDATVTVNSSTWNENRLSVMIDHPKYTATRTIDKDADGNKYIHNSTFFLKGSAGGARGSGFGRELYGRQIENASEAGFKYIDVSGIGQGPPRPDKAKDASEANGYYTWPRFGFDQPIKGFEVSDPKLVKSIHTTFPNAKTLLDVIEAKDVQLPEADAKKLRDTLAENDKALGREPRDRTQIRGSDWWLMNGRSINGVFDLTPGSRSMKVFEAYLQETEKRAKATKAYGAEEGDWDDEDALDAAWDRIEVESRAEEAADILTHLLGDQVEEALKAVKANDCHDEQGRFCSDGAAGDSVDSLQSLASREGAGEGRHTIQSALQIARVLSRMGSGGDEEVRGALERSLERLQPELAKVRERHAEADKPQPSTPFGQHQARLGTTNETRSDTLAASLMSVHENVTGRPMTDADKDKYVQAAHDYFDHATSFFGKVNAGDETALRVVSDAAKADDPLGTHRPDLAYASEMSGGKIGARAGQAAERKLDASREQRGEIKPIAIEPPPAPDPKPEPDLSETPAEKVVRERKERIDNANRLIYRVRYASRGSQGANSSTDFHELADHLTTMSDREIREVREKSNLGEFKGRSKEKLVDAIVSGLRAARERMYGAGKAWTKAEGDDLHAQAVAMADLLGGLLPEEALAFGMIWAGGQPNASKGFCPTGPGGGVDNSCGREGGGTTTDDSHTDDRGEGVHIADADKAEVARIMSKVLGDKATKEDVARMAGAGPGAQVHILPGSVLDRLHVKITHPDYSASRAIGRDADGKGVITNEWVKVPEGKQGDGIGRGLFTRQVEEAAKAGFDRIECRASKSDEHNGYYSWPRMGYNQDVSNLPSSTRAAIAAKYPDAKTVLDVMAGPGGVKWWKSNGETLAHATFDLKEGSKSRLVLDAYNKAKATKAPAGVLSTIGRLFGVSKGAYDSDAEQAKFERFFRTEPG